VRTLTAAADAIEFFAAWNLEATEPCLALRVSATNSTTTAVGVDYEVHAHEKARFPPRGMSRAET
jgi:hypothetical protein